MHASPALEGLVPQPHLQLSPPTPGRVLQPNPLGPPSGVSERPCGMGLCPTAEIQPHPWGCCSKSSSSFLPTKLALLSYFPSTWTQLILDNMVLLSPSPVTYWWPEMNHRTIFPSVCCSRPAGAFEGSSRYGQPKLFFIWRMKNNLMVLVE